MTSLLMGGISPAFAQSNPAANPGQPLTKPSVPVMAPYMPNDEIGTSSTSMSQMRTTTQAMRMAAALNQKQQQKAVTQQFAGINPDTAKLSPLGVVANAITTMANGIATMATSAVNTDYFGIANWAYSPLPTINSGGQVTGGIHKFVDTLPGLGSGGKNDLGQYIPLAVPDTTTFNGNTTKNPAVVAADYYEVGLVEYYEQMHKDLTQTKLAGYVQLYPLGTISSPAAGAVQLTTANGLVQNIIDATTGQPRWAYDKPHYLGPTILAQKSRPVRVKFTNYLPTGTDFFIPIDHTYMGAGMGPNQSLKQVNVTNRGAGYTSAPTVSISAPPCVIGTGCTQAVATANISNGGVVSVTITNGGEGYPSAPAVTLTGGGYTTRGTAAAVITSPNAMENYTENRATLHLHGGTTPWISDGTPHQWTAPAGELTSYSKGDSVSYVPDMWFDASGKLISSCAEQTTCAVAGATNDPGAGSLTFYWTNQQSGRLLFYHDHAFGTTRTDVYAGEAAGYLITDPTEESALLAANVPGTISNPANLADPKNDLAHLIPLVIQDKTYVPDNGAAGGQLAATDPTWDVAKWGGAGNLWLPHVWMPNQNPADISGANAYGRWDYGPWFWPAQDPSTFVPDGLPYQCSSSFYNGTSGPAFPPLMCPGIPNPTGVMEAMMDTPVINGTAYPSVTVDPTAYRFQILNAANDRAWNLGLYVADPLTVAVTGGGSGYSTATPPAVTITPANGATATAILSNGTITSILLSNVGKGYTTAPSVTISAPAAGGVQATATAVVDPITGTISAINIINGGSLYSSATVSIGVPSCTINGSTCVQATATATITPPGSVLGVNLTVPNSASWTTAPTVTIAAPPAGGTQAYAIASVNSEVKMVDAVPHSSNSALPACNSTNDLGGGNLVLGLLDGSGNPLNGTGLEANCYPSSWPTDGRDGGVPDPLTAGPAIVQIGNEAGLLPNPVVIPSTPIGYEYNRKSITVLNIFNHGLLMGPAERAQVLVDFSKYAGKTLILYNDSAAPMPAFDPREDYYTGDPDQTASGGAPSTLPGYGPNTRTIMQIKVNSIVPAAGGSALTGVSLTSGGLGYSNPTVSIAPPGGTGTTATASITGSVSGVTLTTAGTGYTNPQVTIAAPPAGGTQATAAWASGSVSGLTIGNAGSGYSSAPTVSFSGGGGSLAAASTSGTVDALTLPAGGGGYSNTAMTLAAPPAGGTQATASAVGAVDAITLTSGGAGYTAAPAVTLLAPPAGGTQAGATAVLDGVGTVTILNGGKGYATAPTVTIGAAPAAGVTATAQAVLDAVGTITVTNGGSGYTAAPTVTLATPTNGVPATATAALDAVGTVGVTAGGSGYLVAPSVTIAAPTCTAGPGCVQATATATLTAGSVTAITVTNSGAGYTAAPAVTIAAQTGDPGTGASASIAALDAVGTITVTAGGKGYTAVSPVVIAPPTTGATATATAALDSVGTINVTNGGRGYTAAPTITLSAPTTGATATASIPALDAVGTITLTTPGAGYTAAPSVAFTAPPTGGTPPFASTTLTITGLTVGNGGAGYLTAPAVSFTGGGTGAAAASTLRVTGITITSAGSGYTTAPTVTLSAPGGAGVTATAAATIASTGITLINGGAGYTSAPAVTITDAGGTGSGATGTSTLSVTGITMTSGGSGYTALPLVTISDTAPGTGSGAAAAASFAPVTASFNLAPISNAQPNVFAAVQHQMIVPEPGFPAANGGAASPTYLRIQDMTIPGWFGGPLGAFTYTAGSGYTLPPTVTISAPTMPNGTQATMSVSFTGANVSSINLTNGGSGYSAPPVVNLAGGGGTGAAATAIVTGSVTAINVTLGGSGYNARPTVTIAPPPGAGVRATATATIAGGAVTRITITNPGSGYTSPPTVTFSAPQAPDGVRPTAAATVTGSVTSVLVTNSGAGYSSAPAVSFTPVNGGTGAAATAVVQPGLITGVTLTNPGNGYSRAPVVTISGGGGGTGFSVTFTTPTNPLLPKAIQELFTLDYGRMNATLGVEVPFTNFFTQTTIPYGYVDPPTEMFQVGDTQFWKFTHNGVDTHFIHFHLFDVQVINRVGWDGAIKPPDPNEVAWKDTLRMNPLEDIIVALRPVQPNVPWQLPDSVRSMDVTRPIGASNANNTMGFANIDPINEPATVTNDLVNYGWEYVLHCHILEHEEIDMMRPMSLAVPPLAPSNVTVARQGTGNNQRAVVSWRDNAINETDYIIERATNLAGPWVAFAAPALPGSGSTGTYIDTTLARRTTYYYRVTASNVVGYTAVFAAPAVGWPTIAANSVAVYPAAPITTLDNAPTGSPIFSDSFETGLNHWSAAVGKIAVDAKAVAGPYGGKLGLAATLGAAPAYVADHTPTSDQWYTASFYLDPNGASSTTPVDVFLGLDTSGNPIFGVQYQSLPSNGYELRAWVLQNGTQVYTDWVKFTFDETEDAVHSAHKIDIGWQSGAKAGFSFYIDDNLVTTLVGDTSASQMDVAVLGPSLGVSSTASGTMYFDEFSSSQVNGVQLYPLFLPAISN
jgi:FtsP/CotA-like multicopper oxidase with cupredoxin domain